MQLCLKYQKPVVCSSQYKDSDCRWQDCLRESALITVADIAGHLDLSLPAGDVSRLLLDGPLHRLVCRSVVADEPLSSTSISVILTPKQFVLETLAKMSVLEANVDCIMRLVATRHLQTCYNLLKQLAASLWITTFDSKLATSLLTTCNRLVIHKLSQTMRTHPDRYRLVGYKPVARYQN